MTRLKVNEPKIGHNVGHWEQVAHNKDLFVLHWFIELHEESFFPEFVSRSRPILRFHAQSDTLDWQKNYLGCTRVYSLLDMPTWISVAIFDYRVIIRGIIVNIRGVHAVVNITSWHVVYESSKKSPWDFEHGFGRSRTDPIWHHVIKKIEEISHRFMVFDL